ncbi:hypothetical protein D0869_06985 [Hortaea werneckii]|uniref:Uncharacterized protein n=1 Tax=Hortaea werneckii TaxID=91943 RepID=A0A3M7BIG9_HORWE|nr:hypothetical protein KC316_g10392 [Hortaea werneckii]KAI7673671.1 hypothetical protein KC318_g2098 [Hortaea werneckii]RMX81215.1 hypothetical protein D0869_06985 [Hortaea werneckii]RMY04891.1 hypothetical protein D0868_06713 [Hortaea werneckii]RMY17896.1 hypothetical protein D0867_05710 [Hortaea werneckii]
MGEAQSKPVAIIAVNGGRVCEKKANGVLNTAADTGNKAQQWIIEPDPGDRSKMAFKNLGNNQYLRAMTGAHYGKVDTGQKQLWSLEPGHAPGSSWIKCLDYKDAYLCNSYGNHTINNTVWTWSRTGQESAYTHTMLWYLRDAEDTDFNPVATAAANAETNASAAVDPAKAEKELKKREAALQAEKEARLKELEETEASLKKRKEAIAAKEAKLKELDEREAAVKAKEAKLQQLQKKEAALKKLEQDIQAQEAAQKKQAEQLAEREKQTTGTQASPDAANAKRMQAELQKQMDALQEREKKLAAQEAATAKQQEQIASRERELERKDSDKPRVTGGRRKAGAADGDVQQNEDAKPKVTGGRREKNDETEKLEKANLLLQVRIEELEAQLDEARRSRPIGNSGGFGGLGSMKLSKPGLCTFCKHNSWKAASGEGLAPPAGKSPWCKCGATR